MRELGGGQQRLVADAHPVMDLVPGLQSSQNRDGILGRRLIDHDLLEAALEGLVLFDELTVFVDGRGADAAEFAAGEGGLEEVGRVHGSLGGSGSDDGVHLINEQNDLPVRPLHLLQDGLEPLLELSPQTGPRDQRSHIQTDELARRLERIGNVPRDHALRDPLGDGRLSDPRIPDENGIVLRPAAQNLNRATDFVVASDDRIQFPLLGPFGKIDPVLIEGVVHVFGRTGNGRAGLFANLLDRFEHVLVFDALILQRLLGELSVVAGEGEDERFGGDEGIPQYLHPVPRLLQHSLQIPPHHLGGVIGNLGLLRHVLLQLLPQIRNVGARLGQYLLHDLFGRFGVISRLMLGRVEHDVEEERRLDGRRLIKVGRLGQR
mmetsp:Transcript_33472/g.99761  ORF Transcript_33472/g.99761 Transcript_33472/m.99761 type:complete len:377 (+) Transcript_33472:1804-2934(+)